MPEYPQFDPHEPAPVDDHNRLVISSGNTRPLSDKEIKVLQLTGQGLTAAAIAHELNISVYSPQELRDQIATKFGRTVPYAYRACIELGIIDHPQPMRSAGPITLTDDERAAVDLRSRGLTNKQASAFRYIDEAKQKDDLKRAFRKVGASPICPVIGQLFAREVLPPVSPEEAAQKYHHMHMLWKMRAFLRLTYNTVVTIDDTRLLLVRQILPAKAAAMQTTHFDAAGHLEQLNAWLDETIGGRPPAHGDPSSPEAILAAQHRRIFAKRLRETVPFSKLISALREAAASKPDEPTK